MSEPRQPERPDHCTSCHGSLLVDGQPCPACAEHQKPFEPRCFFCGMFLTMHDHGMVSGGGKVTMSFGYGSRHDTDGVDGLVCDDCAPQIVRDSAAAWHFGSALGHPWVNSVQEPIERCPHEVMVGEPPEPRHCAACGAITDYGEAFWGYGRTAYYRASHVNAFEHPMHRLTATKISLMQRAYRAELAGRQLKGWPLTTCYSWREPLQKGRALARQRR